MSIFLYSLISIIFYFLTLELGLSIYLKLNRLILYEDIYIDSYYRIDSISMLIGIVLIWGIVFIRSFYFNKQNIRYFKISNNIYSYYTSY